MSWVAKMPLPWIGDSRASTFIGFFAFLDFSAFSVLDIVRAGLADDPGIVHNPARGCERPWMPRPAFDRLRTAAARRRPRTPPWPGRRLSRTRCPAPGPCARARTGRLQRAAHGSGDGNCDRYWRAWRSSWEPGVGQARGHGAGGRAQAAVAAIGHRR